MYKQLVLAVLLAMLVALPGLAQDEQKTEPKAEGEAIHKVDLQGVLELPKRTKEAREAGIPEKDVREVLEAAKQHKLSPEETSELMAESTKAAKENGNVDNFGAFVKAKMGEGLRGKELANAIHEEHRVRGKGKTYREKEMHGGKAEDGKGHGDPKQHQEKEKQMQGEGESHNDMQKKDMQKGDKSEGGAGNKKADKGDKKKGKGGSA